MDPPPFLSILDDTGIATTTKPKSICPARESSAVVVHTPEEARRPPDHHCDRRRVVPSLVTLCRQYIVTNLLSDSTPVTAVATTTTAPRPIRAGTTTTSTTWWHAFGLLDSDEFTTLLRHKHKLTTPHNGEGGLDGTGRLTPAVSAKFLSRLEHTFPHLIAVAPSPPTAFVVSSFGHPTPEHPHKVSSSPSPLAPSLTWTDDVDQLIWRDCVEYRFRRQSTLIRPRTLWEPWPLLVQQIQETQTLLRQQCHAVLARDPSTPQRREWTPPWIPWRSLAETLRDRVRQLPMSVRLLQHTGIGKTVHQCRKQLFPQGTITTNAHDGGKGGGSRPTVSSRDCHDETRDSQVPDVTHVHGLLTELLENWKQMAAQYGVVTADGTPTPSGRGETKKSLVTVPSSSKSSSSTTTPSAATTVPDPRVHDLAQSQEELRDLERRGQSWRQLYQLLAEREERSRNRQGQRMREIRQSLASGRPKIVKVRPTSARYDRVLERGSGAGTAATSTVRHSVAGASSSSLSTPQAKLLQIRREAQLVAARQQRPTTTVRGSVPFSAAALRSSSVAFSTATSTTATSSRGASSFGAAVAFASVGKKRKLLPTAPGTREVQLDGGKRMKIPLSRKHGGGLAPNRGTSSMSSSSSSGPSNQCHSSLHGKKIDGLRQK